MILLGYLTGYIGHSIFARVVSSSFDFRGHRRNDFDFVFALFCTKWL